MAFQKDRQQLKGQKRKTCNYTNYAALKNAIQYTCMI